MQQKQTLQSRQDELFHAQKKLDIYRAECERLGDHIQTEAARLNQHIDYYAHCLAKRNLMVKSGGRDSAASKALIAKAEAACLRLETLVESLRTGSQEAQRRIFRVFKSQVNQAVQKAVAAMNQTLLADALAEYAGDLESFQVANSNIVAQDSGWQERANQTTKIWLRPEKVLDQFNLNILQLERQVNFHRQEAMQSENASILSSGQSALCGFAHYAWMPSFYRSGTHFQIIANNDADKSIFLLNLLGWIEYNIPRASTAISQFSNKTEGWQERDVTYFGNEGTMRHWNEFQGLLETRLRSQRQIQSRKASDTTSELVPNKYREHYALFDDYEQLLPYIPQKLCSEFRSVLVAGDIPKMHLIFVGQSPNCGSMELTSEHLQRVARIIVGEGLIAILLQEQGAKLFGSQFKEVQQQFEQWCHRTKAVSDETTSTTYRSFGLIVLEQQWQFVLLPPPGYFARKSNSMDYSTRLQDSLDIEHQSLETDISLIHD